ncbi:MAG: hypothetical protein DRJ30_02475 [Candidatus Methanomethylicota archaeon]|nr:MAG: hypothetical protein DRJ30_02475 [Candidatus Verstraetearchaeota archaeon]
MSLRPSKFLYEPDDALLEAMPIHIEERESAGDPLVDGLLHQDPRSTHTLPGEPTLEMIREFLDNCVYCLPVEPLPILQCYSSSTISKQPSFSLMVNGSIALNPYLAISDSSLFLMSSVRSCVP